jgi:hypothetical protein
MYYAIVITFVILIIITFLFLVPSNITEKFTNDPIIDIISKYFKNTETDYKSYVELLINEKNTNMTIIKLDTYYEFKTLQSLGLLTSDKIAMKLI